MNKQSLGTVISATGLVAAAAIFGIRMTHIVPLTDVVFYAVSISAIALSVIGKLVTRCSNGLPAKA